MGGYSHERVKSNAKLFYKNNTGPSIGVPLIYTGIYAGAYIVMYIIELILMIPLSIATLSSESEEASIVFSLISTLIVYGLTTVVMVGVMPIVIGTASWFRKSIYEKTSVAEVFAPYAKGRLWGSIGTMLLMGLYIFLWALLLYIPGIIKSFSYSQTIYIKGENPNISASRAITLSRIMMDGHKGDLFYLHLSFIGWFILSMFTFNILSLVYVTPYYYAAQAFAYEEFKADAISRGVIDPAELSPSGDSEKTLTLIEE